MCANPKFEKIVYVIIIIIIFLNFNKQATLLHKGVEEHVIGVFFSQSVPGGCFTLPPGPGTQWRVGSTS